MKISKKRTVIAALAIIVIGCHFTQPTLPSDAGSSCESGPQALTPAMVNSWFESGAVSLNGAVNPANSVTFPNNPNCSFYQWSEQMFLWLTSPAPARYGGNGLVMNTPAFYDVSLPDAMGERHFLEHTPGLIRAFNLRTAQKGALDLPVILEKKSLRLLEILPPVMSESGKQLVMDKDGNEVEVNKIALSQNRQLILSDINGKEIQGPRAIIQSAKDSLPSAVTIKLRKIENFDRTSLVQKFETDHTVLLLDLSGSFHEVEQGQADGSVLMAQNGSLVYYSLTVNNVFALYRTMQGTTVPTGTQFPTTQPELNNISAFAITNGKSPIIDSMALAIEIKCSWVEAAGLPDSNKFIHMKAVVPTYDKTNPNDWVPNGTQVIELAMVGMHIVGSTADHPEMLWSTFEQLSNDPAAAYSYLTTGGATTSVPENTTGVWNFCSSGSAGPFNIAHMRMGGAGGMHIVNVSGQTISPTDIERTMPWGLSGLNANGNAEVISTNNVVRSLLDPADVRINYIQTGTTWTIGGASPTPGSGTGNQVGTNMLSNTTMETFVQPANCFGCHNTNTTVVSHVFNETAPLF
jgi:hypothetical protein